MKPIPTFIVVVHVKDDVQAVRQTGVAFTNGAQGVFLIHHQQNHRRLCDIYNKVRFWFPDVWLGLNFLDLAPEKALAQAPFDVDGMWLDSTEGLNASNVPANRSYAIFAGTAFKYQPQPDDLERAVRDAADLFDVVCTSGPGTGEAIDVHKLCSMYAVSRKPLALASGVTVENVDHFLPHVDCIMVNTGVSKDFHTLDPERVRALAGKLQGWINSRQPSGPLEAGLVKLDEWLRRHYSIGLPAATDGWQSGPPQEPGKWWLLGDVEFGTMGSNYTGGQAPRRRLDMVRVQRISDGLSGVCDGRFVRLTPFDPDNRAPGYVGVWRKVVSPALPEGFTLDNDVEAG